MLLRSDGLLRGSREERIQAVLSLRDAEWNLATLLDLHCGLLDHAEDVRVSAMDALQDIAKRKPKPLQITPMMLLSEFLFSFTAVSGMAVSALEFFVQLDTPEARQAVGRALLRVQRRIRRTIVAVIAIHPGEHLAEELKELGMSAAELARQIEIPTNRVTEVLNGKRGITGDTALRHEAVVTGLWECSLLHKPGLSANVKIGDPGCVLLAFHGQNAS